MADCIEDPPPQHARTSHQLATFRLFRQLSARDLAVLEAQLLPVRYDEGETIVRVGDPGDEFFLIGSGRVDVSCPDDSGKEVPIGALRAGEFFGELALLDGGPRTANVIARGHVILLSLKRERFIEFLRGHPDAAIHMLQEVGHRQRETIHRVRGIDNPNEAFDRQRSHWQFISERIARATATQWFVCFNLLFAIGWMVVNYCLRRFGVRFDGDHFDILGLIITIEGLFITLFVLISQNIQSERERLKADLDYHVNLKMHEDIMQLHHKVERIQASLTSRQSSD